MSLLGENNLLSVKMWTKLIFSGDRVKTAPVTPIIHLLPPFFFLLKHPYSLSLPFLTASLALWHTSKAQWFYCLCLIRTGQGKPLEAVTGVICLPRLIRAAADHLPLPPLSGEWLGL